MIRLCTLLFAFMALPAASAAHEEHTLDWLTGCWVSEDGATREVWSSGEGGYFFGYGVTYNEDKPVFFEQLRIDNREPPVLNAYPAGNGPTQFPAVEVGDELIRFANEDHDFPQRIDYARNGELLIAMIAKMDGSNASYFVYEPCGT